MKHFLTVLALLLLPILARADSIVLGGGCFWCMDAAYKLLPGVTHVTCGYAGGHTKYPTYEDVCTETTGHAETVQVDFDPKKVSLAEVLKYFFECHNPTQVNGQGDDLGTSYRSIILYADDAQKAAAEAARTEAQKRFSDPIVTEIVPLKKFWIAEDYHQDYFEKNPDRDYCRIVIRPKVEKLQHLLNQ
ncbi:MAG TPA: peptide-methionine (S)-S-oxide reductase MsrA [Opitutaceae bacterium]